MKRGKNGHNKCNAIRRSLEENREIKRKQQKKGRQKSKMHKSIRELMDET